MNKELSNISLQVIDELGRISLPIEYRKILMVKEGGKVEIGVDNNKLIIKRHSPLTNLKEWSRSIVKALSSVIEHDILICDTDKVIDASKRKYISKLITSNLQEIMYKRDVVIKREDDESQMVDIFAEIKYLYCCQLIVPIIKDNDVLGAIVVLALENKCFNEDTVKVCKAFSNLLNDLIS